MSAGEIAANGLCVAVLIAAFLAAIRPAVKLLLMVAAIAALLGLAAAPYMVVQYFARADMGQGSGQ